VHGEFVANKGDGTFQTVDVQRGEVTDVSASSITVKSADGFIKSYAVTATTIVNAARDGIGSVKVADVVNVTATVDGTTATAEDVMDITTLKANGGPLHFGRRGDGPPPAEGDPAPISPATGT